LIFDQLEFVRKGTLKIIEVTEEPQLTMIPKGFNNNILWNLGHIYVIQEQMVFPPMGEPSHLNEPLIHLFNKKTTPMNWTIEPPTLDELTTLLKNQTTRIRDTFGDRPDDNLLQPFTLFKSLTFNSLSDVLTFTMFHEGMHLETMKMYVRMLKADHK
jgi:uncharacterized protein (DUF1810 family)